MAIKSIKAAFPAAPDPIQGIPMLVSLIDLMLNIYHCLQTQKTPASATMTMLFCAASPGLYSSFDEALSIAMHAMRVGVHLTMGSSPGTLVFNRVS